MDKPYISASQVTLYGNCGEAYRRRYIEKEIIPPGIVAVRGSAVHKGAEHNFLQKIESKVDLSKSEIVDKAVAEFDSRINGDGVLLSSEEVSEGKDNVIGAQRDATARLTGLYADEVAPVYQPASVEERQRIVMPGTRDILGILDLTATREGSGVGIVDYKTAKRAKPKSGFDTSTALSIYTLTFKAKHGVMPAFTAIEQLIDTKVPKRVQVEVEKTERDLDVTLNRIAAVVNAIEKQVFTPAPTDSWMCNQRWCGYARTCRFYNAERSGDVE